MYANSRSLPKHLNEYELLFTYTENKINFQFDVMCFVETWLRKDNKNIAKFNGYQHVIKHKAHTGEVEYLSEDLIPNTEVNFECVVIEIRQQHGKNIIIGSFHQSPSQTNVRKFINSLEEILAKIELEGKEVIITGDFNIDLLKIDTCSHNYSTDL